MIMNIIASIVLAYFILRECGYVRRSWSNGYAPGWIMLGSSLVIALLLVLWAVWS